MTNVIIFRGAQHTISPSHIRELKQLPMRVPVTVLDYLHPIKRYCNGLAEYKHKQSLNTLHAKEKVTRDIMNRIGSIGHEYLLDSVYRQTLMRKGQLIVIINVPTHVSIKKINDIFYNMQKILLVNSELTMWSLIKFSISMFLHQYTNTSMSIFHMAKEEIIGHEGIKNLWTNLINTYCDDMFQVRQFGSRSNKPLGSLRLLYEKEES